MDMDKVNNRLVSLGYTVNDTDTFILDFCIEKTEFKIKKECNLSEIPVELENVAIDMVCGEFLMNKKNSGQLVGFDIEPLVKSIQIGDTSTTFMDTTSKDAQLNLLLNSMINPSINYGAYRKIKWTK